MTERLKLLMLWLIQLGAGTALCGVLGYVIAVALWAIMGFWFGWAP